MNKFIIIFCLVFVTGCVSNLPYDQQIPNVGYKKNGTVCISVVDKRKRVAEGKPKSFIGVAHATFGIPVSWKINPVLAVEEGDKKRELAQWLQNRIVGGFNAKGWQVKTISSAILPSHEEVGTVMQEEDCGSMIVLRINEWYFSINLNLVSAFNFDTDTDVIVYAIGNGEILNKNFAGRDVIEEYANDSPRNRIMVAYREQLTEILSDPEVKQALIGSMMN